MLPTNVIFIFFILVAGYLFCNIFHRTHWLLKRSSGYHTFFLSATAGVVILVIAFLGRGALTLAQGSEFILLDRLLESALPSISVSNESKILIELIVAALFLAVVVPLLLSFIVGRVSGNTRQELLNGSFVDSPTNPEFTTLIFSSFEQGLPVMFTLSDRKVFIGYPVLAKAEDFNDIRVLPTVSGYRKQDTLELVLTTDYETVLRDLINEKEADPESFLTTLPTREIVHAHLFDLNHHPKFTAGSSE